MWQWVPSNLTSALASYLSRPEPGGTVSHDGTARHAVTPPVERDPDSDSLYADRSETRAKHSIVNMSGNGGRGEETHKT